AAMADKHAGWRQRNLLCQMRCRLCHVRLQRLPYELLLLASSALEEPMRWIAGAIDRSLLSANRRDRFGVTNSVFCTLQRISSWPQSPAPRLNGSRTFM